MIKNQPNSMLWEPALRTTSINEYYFSQKLQQVARMQKEGNDVINLGIGNPDLPPAPEVIQALGLSAAQAMHHGYQSYRGTDALRIAFSEWYARIFSVQLDPFSEILPLMGSKEGIVHISLTFLNPGDRVLFPDPGYPAYAAAAGIAGAEAVAYPLSSANAWLPDLDAIAETNLHKVKIMWVNYPHMPSGARANQAFFAKLLAFGKKHNILICHDNPYGLISNPEPLSILFFDESKGAAIELNSLSKSHNMAGWRLGLVAGDAALLNEVLKVKSNMDSGMFRPVQDAAVKALSLGESWYDQQNFIYSKRRKVAESIAQVLGCSFESSQAGMFLWAEIPENYTDSEELTEIVLHNAHVFITPGKVFGKRGKTFIRISLCAPEERMQQAYERISNLNLR